MTEPDAPAVRFKIAAEDGEFAQIHALHYQTFVEEIPQHPASPEHLLIDRFHADNTYVIALRGERLVGTVALRTKRPFSLDQKIPALDTHLPAGRKICEIRLLATTKESRTGVVFRGLVDLLVKHGLQCGYDLAIISGTLRQTRLYKHLGFIPFGPVVGAGEALFQPMYLTLESFREHARAFPAAR